MYSISIIIPTFQERATIEEVLDKTCQVLKASDLNAEIIVVDDNSSDGTGDVVQAFSKEHPNVRVVVRSCKAGLASACIYGFSKASPESKILGVMDADLSHAPESLPYLINPILYNMCDMTVGSRYVPGGRVLNWPLRRYVMSRVACGIGAFLTTVKDVTSGFFFFKRHVIEEAPLDPVGFKICLEVLVKGRYQTAKEVPFTFSDRITGKSKVGAGEVIKYLKHVRALYAFKRRYKDN